MLSCGALVLQIVKTFCNKSNQLDEIQANVKLHLKVKPLFD